MSKHEKASLENLEQPVVELTPEEAETAKGGIVIVNGKNLGSQLLLGNNPGFAADELNPQSLPAG